MNFRHNLKKCAILVSRPEGYSCSPSSHYVGDPCPKSKSLLSNEKKLDSCGHTFSLLHHGARLRECKALHGLVALAHGSLLVASVYQHPAVEGVALLAGSLSAPGRPISCCRDQRQGGGEERGSTNFLDDKTSAGVTPVRVSPLDFGRFL